MTDREVMQMALDALTAWDARGRLRVMEALRTALAQPESEPVAWMRPKFMIDDWCDELGFTKSSDEDIPLYTAPPQRKEWVGLTPDEHNELTLCSNALLDHIYEHGTTSEGVLPRLKSLFTAVEAKLKEKNI